MSVLIAPHPYRAEVEAIFDEIGKEGLDVVSVYDGEEAIEGDDVETVLSVDESWVNIHGGGSIYIVLGNEAGSAICDYASGTCIINGTLSRITATIAKRFAR